MKTLKHTQARSWLVRWVVFIILCGVAWAPGRVGAAIPHADVYVFWRVGCPHCSREQEFLEQLAAEEPRIRVHAIEIGGNPLHREAFLTIVRRAGIGQPAVPLTVIGETVLEGYNDDSTTGAAIRAGALDCLQYGCRDWVRPLLESHRESLAELPLQVVDQGDRAIKLPLFGEVRIGQVSLPVLTILLAAVDGFNPCAMWTLLFLVGLLVGLRDRFRMWVLGGAFILASAAVYYLFMAAWLNVLLFLGMLIWIRVLIGVLALVGGGYYIHEYFVNPAAICRVTAPESRRRTLYRLRSLVGERNFLIALTGIILLAFAVNLFELICSAGLPAVYTQVLALSHLAVWQYHAYLALYILVFMLDDLFVFFVAMQTLKLTGLTGAYVRQAHLIGGAVMLLVGLMLLFKPAWLSFS